MQDVIDSDGFRINIGIVLMGPDARLFLGRRARGRGGWQFPQGGVGRGEALEESLFRELREEIGLSADDVQVAGRTRDWVRYRLPARYVRHDLHPLCLGQKQRWFLLRLRPGAAAFRFDATPQPEFDHWRWAEYWEPLREVVYFKRAVYRRVLQEFGPVAFPDGRVPDPTARSGPAARTVAAEGTAS